MKEPKGGVVLHERIRSAVVVKDEPAERRRDHAPFGFGPGTVCGREHAEGGTPEPDGPDHVFSHPELLDIIGGVKDAGMRLGLFIPFLNPTVTGRERLVPSGLSIVELFFQLFPSSHCNQVDLERPQAPTGASDRKKRADRQKAAKKDDAVTFSVANRIPWNLKKLFHAFEY